MVSPFSMTFITPFIFTESLPVSTLYLEGGGVTTSFLCFFFDLNKGHEAEADTSTLPKSISIRPPKASIFFIRIISLSISMVAKIRKSIE
jgi:hypothetical protein